VWGLVLRCQKENCTNLIYCRVEWTVSCELNETELCIDVCKKIHQTKKNVLAQKQQE
jgi:hypothetical protein